MNGDDGFVSTNNFLTPYSGTRIGIHPDAFNYTLSKMRQFIERAFGNLAQRWGILWRPLRVSFKFWPRLLSALAKLHNFCIDSGDVAIGLRGKRDVEDDDEFKVLTNNFHDDEHLRPRNLASSYKCEF